MILRVAWCFAVAHAFAVAALVLLVPLFRDVLVAFTVLVFFGFGGIPVVAALGTQALGRLAEQAPSMLSTSE